MVDYRKVKDDSRFLLLVMRGCVVEHTRVGLNHMTLNCDNIS
jgi:hypothetical protein